MLNLAKNHFQKRCYIVGEVKVKKIKMRKQSLQFLLEQKTYGQTNSISILLKWYLSDKKKTKG